uniref:uncharacterized protein LOC120342023 n=1 Tax=Styela clava TaxID=7725 RepID=UPI0019399F02|nr:uncharacterized protein LOC120342023 [Styela clava]
MRDNATNDTAVTQLRIININKGCDAHPEFHRVSSGLTVSNSLNQVRAQEKFEEDIQGLVGHGDEGVNSEDDAVTSKEMKKKMRNQAPSNNNSLIPYLSARKSWIKNLRRISQICSTSRRQKSRIVSRRFSILKLLLFLNAKDETLTMQISFIMY